MTLPSYHCSYCGLTLAHAWITVLNHVFCGSCSTRSTVVIPVFTEAGHCLVPCDCVAKAEALNATHFVYDGPRVEEGEEA